MAQDPIRPRSGPNRRPTFPTSSPATCSVKCACGRRASWAWQPCASCASTLPSAAAACLQRPHLMSQAEHPSSVSLPRSLPSVSSSIAGTRARSAMDVQALSRRLVPLPPRLLCPSSAFHRLRHSFTNPARPFPASPAAGVAPALFCQGGGRVCSWP